MKEGLNTFEKAYRNLIEEVYHNKIRPGSVQWNEMRICFYAGAIWFIDRVHTHPDELMDLLEQTKDFYKEVEITGDIVRAGK